MIWRLRTVVLLVLLAVGQSCTDYSDYEQVGDYRFLLTEVGPLPTVLPECSGMAYHEGSLIALNDGGNGSFVYELSATTGELVQQIPIAGTDNMDWEALALYDGELVIADTGNNDGSRQSQTLYHIDANTYSKSSTTTFALAGQPMAPSMNHNYDCEALSLIDGDYYLWTKNRGNDSTNLWVGEIGTSEFSLRASMPVAGLITDSYYHEPSDTHLLLCNERHGSTFASAIEVVTIDDEFKVTSHATLPLMLDDKVEAITWVSDDRFLLASESKQMGDLGMLYEIALVGL